MDELKLKCIIDSNDTLELEDASDREIRVAINSYDDCMFFNFDDVKKLNEWTAKWLKENSK